MYKNFKITILFLGLILLSSVYKSYGKQSQWHPVNIGNGPLLFFNQSEDLKEKTNVEGKLLDRMEVLYVFDPASQKPPQVIWSGGAPTPHPLQHLEPNTFLFDHKYRLFMVDTAQGKVNSILPNNLQTKLITIEESKIYFLERQVPFKTSPYHLYSLNLSPFTFNGFGFRTFENGDTGLAVYYAPRDYICVVDWSKEEKPKRLTELEVERVLEVEEQQFWVVTAGENRKICRIQKDGEIEEIVPFDSHWVAALTDSGFSPNRKYLALGLYHDQHDYYTERELVVIDLEQKNIAFTKERIPLKKIKFIESFYPPPFIFGWSGDTKISYMNGDIGIGFVDFETGEYGEVQITKRTTFDLPQERHTEGYFDIEGVTLFFQGEDTPIGERNNLEISPQGEWAAFLSAKDKNTYIVDGRKKEKTLLISGWSNDLKWLPAIK